MKKFKEKFIVIPNLFRNLIGYRMLKQVQHDGIRHIYRVFIISLLTVLLLPCSAEEDELQMVKSGMFVKVMSAEEINTLVADKDDVVKFINLQDMYVYETNVIPENTVFYGIVEDVREPVRGTDGAIKIFINKMITPDNQEYEIKGHIYTPNANYIGGKTTSSMYYHKLYNHSRGFRPMLQVVPLNILEQGRHTVIRAGSEFFIVIEEDIILK